VDLDSVDTMTPTITNWAENFTFSTDRVHQPNSVEQVQEVVAGCERMRPLGTGHSFNRIADTTADLVSVAALPQRCEIDAAASTVTVSAGMRYGDVAVLLSEAGYALPNLASLPHISVAGAIATGTHGSGVKVGNLATAVTALQLVKADGTLVHIDTSDSDFPGCVVSLGALGVVTAVTLRIQPAVPMRQWIYDAMPRDALDDNIEEILGSAYSVSIFLDWRSESLQVWRKHRVDEPGTEKPPARWLGATLAERPRHPIDGQPSTNATEQFGVLGPWHLRLPHFRMEFTPSNGEELQTEYLMPREHAVDAIAAIESLRSDVAPLAMISEIRTIAADDLWMSPSYQRDSVALHFTWFQDIPGVTAMLKPVEEALEPLSPRPHWGKVFAMGGDRLAGRYPRYQDFVALMRRYDPAGKFRNETLDGWFPTR
jgi:xylitol oxidase